MDEPIIVGIDVGTTKICTLVARVEDDGHMRILGAGIEPSRGMRKGVPVDLPAASQAIARSKEKAERTSSRPPPGRDKQMKLPLLLLKMVFFLSCRDANHIHPPIAMWLW